MFERRLKIFLIALFVVTLVLAARAVQVQLVHGGHYRAQALKVMTDAQLTKTTRGRILDVKGRVIALDEPCIDAAVEYPAIPARPDERWVRNKADQRLRKRDAYRGLDRPARRALIDEEAERVKLDVQIMWATLAQMSDRQSRLLERAEDAPPLDAAAEIVEIRRGIESRVEQRRAYLHSVRYQRALAQYRDRGRMPWYERWLSGGEKPPQPADYDIEIAEMTAPHIILHDISAELYNELGKNIEKYPGLRLQEGIKRTYPFREAGCHLIGRLSRVTAEDVKNQGDVSELRRYQLNDRIGRTGLEALCEPTLRGTRGRVDRIAGEQDHVLEVIEPQPGKDVRSTIDIVLQHRVQQMLKRVKIINPDRQTFDEVSMHAAAVVVDVPTGEVRVLASNPDFDANRFDEVWARLKDDELNSPFLNRATQAAVPPGSTVKPIVGLGGITQGLIGPYHGIECTGYLIINGVRYRSIGRCWTASQFESMLGVEGVKHHQQTGRAPHRGHHGNRDGWLSFSDSIERSCNIYFENVAHMMRHDGLIYWFRQFGLGMPTGIGLTEVSGELPRGRQPAQVWFGGIGQGMTATPLQMANVAATIARNGTWVRPTLVREGAPPRNIPGQVDRINLKLSREALQEARDGMIRVVSGPGGTGTQAYRPDLLVAGKTGSAQDPRPRYLALRDPVTGELLRDEEGKVVKELIEPSTHSKPNPLAPWYRATGPNEDEKTHAWYVGFAPANDPKIAFAVLIEYGGGGGAAAGLVAAEIIEQCIQQGYLQPGDNSVAMVGQ